MIRKELERLEETTLHLWQQKAVKARGGSTLQSPVKSARSFNGTGIKSCIVNPFGV